mgnify:CR=1 FL=1
MRMRPSLVQNAPALQAAAFGLMGAANQHGSVQGVLTVMASPASATVKQPVWVAEL